MKTLHKNTPNELIIRTINNEIVVTRRADYHYENKQRLSKENSMRFIVAAFILFVISVLIHYAV